MPKNFEINWIPTSLMAERLGVDLKLFREMRSRFKKGVHYYVVNEDAKRPTYKWNPQATFKAMGVIISDETNY